MKLTIILATCDRAHIISTTLDSIAKLHKGNFSSVQLIVVDQSFDNKTYQVLTKYKNKIDYIYIHALQKGLSHSRNIGLELASGDYVCFGDDDCSYNENLLIELINSEKDYKNYGLLCGVVKDPKTDLLTSYTKSSKEHEISRNSFYKDITSISIYLKRDFLTKNGIKFDERFGLGSIHPSCEEVDFIRKALDVGIKGVYLPTLITYHQNQECYDPSKTQLYAIGHGAYCKKLLSIGGFVNIRYVAFKFLKVLLKFPYSIFKNGTYPSFYLKGFCKGFLELKND